MSVRADSGPERGPRRGRSAAAIKQKAGAEGLPLEKCVLFQAMSADDRLTLAGRARRQVYAPGKPICHVGDPGNSMMVILSGTLRVSLPTIGGREIILADLGPGELFGEIALLDGRGRSADATALTELTGLVLDRPDVLAFLSQRPDVCLRLLTLVCGRLRISDERMTDIASSELEVRLAKAILRRLPSSADDLSSPRRVTLSQGELAGMINGSREAVNRRIAEWQRLGLVVLTDGGIEVNRPSELAAIAGLL